MLRIGPKKACLRVVKVNDEMAFAVSESGRLCIDELSPYDVFSNSDRNERTSAKIEVCRGGQLIDTGSVREVGTHCAQDFFCGFMKIAPDVERVYSDVIAGHLKARWFEEGDEIRFSTAHRTIRKYVISNWHAQLQRSPEFKSVYEAASERRNNMMSERFGVTVSANAKSGRQQQSFLRMWRRTGRIAFCEVHKTIGKVPLPPVIHWEKPY